MVIVVYTDGIDDASGTDNGTIIKILIEATEDA